MSNTNYKVLIIEDEEAIRAPYAMYLRDRGFTVEEAKDGKEGLEKANSFDYDIMLLDIMLPLVDGLEVLKTVKTSPKLKDKKVLLLTALQRDSVIKEGFELGADGYFMKSQEDPESVEKIILKQLAPES